MFPEPFLFFHIPIYGFGFFSALGILATYFVNAVGWGNEVDGAIGQTEILFTLYDAETGQEVWRENVVEGSEEAAKGAYVQAAKDSLTKALQTFLGRLEPYAKANLSAR